MATRVLVVESDGLLAETYRRFLAREGFDVRTARTADECLSSFLEFAPDAIMLEPDVMASRAGAGSEFARNQTASIPIVVVTRQDLQRTDMPDTWHIARHFVKPVSMARLANAIREVIEERVDVS
jgi:DNA-binding response OmpR family regulator